MSSDHIKHAIQRASERYGINLSMLEYLSMVHKIQQGAGVDTVFLGHLTARLDERGQGIGPRSVFRVRHGKQWVLAIYSNKYKDISTFYTLDMVLNQYGADLTGETIDDLRPIKRIHKNKIIPIERGEYAY